MTIKNKKKKNLPLIIGGVVVALVGGFIAYKKGLITKVVDFFKKKEA